MGTLSGAREDLIPDRGYGDANFSLLFGSFYFVI